jgi:uncharacterized protein (DUF4213/DUF364 family)
MSFATDVLAQLDRFAACAPLPRMRALHLPPDPPPGHDRGEFCALELEDGSIGLSYVLLDDTLAALRGTGRVDGSDALALARRYADGHGAERTLGLAAVNALSRCLFDRAGFAPPAAADSVGLGTIVPGDRVGMIGFFKPLVPRIVAAGADLTIVELRADLVGEHDGWRVTLDAAALAGCRRVLATGTLLLNDTLERMLAHCAGSEVFALVGPSVGCLPDALFARGITQIGGSWITEPRAFIDTLEGGALRNAHARKFSLRREDWPGFEALLARL